MEIANRRPKMKIGNNKGEPRMIKWKLILLILLSIFIINSALNNDLTIKEYDLESKKINEPITVALLTDLHGGVYGEGQTELLGLLYKQDPDLVLFGGDIADSERNLEYMMVLTSSVAARYPCYYVLGNHEYRRRDIQSIENALSEQGVHLLRGECVELNINGQNINLSGIDDLDFGVHIFQEQLKSSARSLDIDNYSILLTHRPEQIALYLNYDFDLILAGHTHGGQWRIPYILNGLWAPDQGFFPKYGGGKYEFGDTILLISRGLAHQYTRIPRLFNPPEIVIIDIEPKG